MKKFVSIFLVLSIYFFSTNISIADEPPLEGSVKASVASYAPQWDEFCPPQYVNAQYVNAKEPSILLGVLLSATVILYPVAQYRLDKYTNVLNGNYWAQRHKAFESEIKLCLADESTALACFMQVRQMEDNKNGQYTNNQLVLQAQQAAQSAQIMTQAVNNFQNQMQNVQAQQTNNSYQNVNASINAASGNNKALKAKICQNKCDTTRTMCHRAVQSAPSFGNDNSLSQSAHLSQCDSSYSSCVAQCSF